MDVDTFGEHRFIGSTETSLEQLREEIALIQSLDLQDHSEAYEQIHTKLEVALRSIDGK